MLTGILLLEDAALHAVVADAVAGAGAHRVVDGHEGQRPDGVALPAELVHLRDLFVERAALERNAQGVLLPGGRLGVEEALGAGVLLPVVAEQAVVRFAQDLATGHPRVRQAEPLAAPVSLRRPDATLGESGVRALGRHETLVVERFGQLEGDPAPYRRAKRGVLAKKMAPEGIPLEELVEEGQELLVGLAGGAGQFGGSARRPPGAASARAPPRASGETSGFFFWRIVAMKSASMSSIRTAVSAVASSGSASQGSSGMEVPLDRPGRGGRGAGSKCSRSWRQLGLHRAAEQEVAPEAEQDGLRAGGRRLAAPLVFDAEEPGDELAERTGGVDEEPGSLERRSQSSGLARYAVRRAWSSGASPASRFRKARSSSARRSSRWRSW